MDTLNANAYKLRQDTLDIIMAGQCGHIGGDMSVMEILVALYSKMNIHPDNVEASDRDRFVLSKGHCVEALYAVLADKGFLPLDEILATYSRFGSRYIGHPYNKLPGIEMNSGSLGHGLGVCVGMALAGKRDRQSYRVYTVMGDGELAEGSVWEAAMAAAHYRLDNLCAVIDRNGLQISGPTEEIMAHENLHLRFAAFGWNVIDVVDGNDAYALCDALTQAENVKGMPTVLIAHTTKGKGSAVMENQAGWHHRVPTAEEYVRISRDFRTRKEALS